MLGRLALVSAFALALASCNGVGGSRDQIKVVGSSTVFPFTKAVAEAYAAKYSDRKAPVVESTGSVAGFKLFCAGVGPDFPDISDASRRITKGEVADCQSHGVGEIMEIPIGIDGIAVAQANNGPKMQLTLKDLYLALAANPRGKPNTSKTWKDVDPALPAIPIQVYGPPSTSGTRDSIMDLFLERGCLTAYDDAKKLQGDQAKFDDVCRKIRDDGPYIDKGENDNVIVQGLATNPNAVGMFGYSYLEANLDRIHGIAIEGVEPTSENITGNKYPGARLLYIYVKKRHLKSIPGLSDFIQLYSTMWDAGGPLTKKGLLPMGAKTKDTATYVISAEAALDPADL